MKVMLVTACGCSKFKEFTVHPGLIIREPLYYRQDLVEMFDRPDQPIPKPIPETRYFMFHREDILAGVKLAVYVEKK